ncbi:MAG: magnesium transporter [Pseudomonadota bacterium]
MADPTTMKECPQSALDNDAGDTGIRDNGRSASGVADIDHQQQHETIDGEKFDNDAAQAPLLEDDQSIAEAFVDRVSEAIVSNDEQTVSDLCDDLHPADLADVIGLLDEEERIALVGLLGGVLPGPVLAELDADLIEDLVKLQPTEAIAAAVADLDTDDAAFILEELEENVRAEILADVPLGERIALNKAFDYGEETAGRLMQRDVFAAPAYWTTGQIIDRLRAADDLPDRFYDIFVIDPAFKPIGVVGLSTLLRSTRETRIDAIMSGDLYEVPVDMDREDVGYKFEKYNLISAPVIDEGGRLIGMITVDDVVEVVHEETQEDMLALGGVEADTGLADTVFETVRSRFSWLAVNLLTAILASFVIALFDGAISQIVALAILMPIVASMGGNAGTQTLTVAVRSLATKDLTPSNTARIVWREAKVGLLNGLLFAVIMGGLAATWYNVTTGNGPASFQLGAVVGVAMIVNLLAAALAGILVPIALQRAGHDPAVSSAVFVTTVTDIIGFFVFLGLAAVVLL